MTVLLVNLILLAFAVVGVAAFFPDYFNLLFFQGIFLHLPHIVFIVVAVFIFKAAAWIAHEGREALGFTYMVLAVICGMGGWVLVESGSNWQTAKYYGFSHSEHLVSVKNDSIRFMPLQVAYQDLLQNNATSSFTVEEQYTDAIDLDGKFGYVSPIVPDGTIVTFTNKNDGFIVFSDDPSVPDEKRTRRVKQPFTLGEDMQIQDNLERALYQHSMFTIYTDIYYLQLDPSKPDEFTAIAPKIRYQYRFPFFLIPVWDGLTLVHADGSMEDRNADEATADPRLKGRKLFPFWLARKVVEVQIYDQGYWGGWFKRAGKIEIPSLAGKGANQMPFFTQAASGKSYFVVATEPDGQAYALYRIYYVDASTGERFYFEWDVQHGVLGPRAAQDRVYNLPGYRWIKDGNEDGDFQVIEPVYLTKESRLYWKFTVTNSKFAGITSTVVVDAQTKQMHEFQSRAAFFAWLGGRQSMPVADMETTISGEDPIKALEEWMAQGHQLLLKLREHTVQ